MRDDLFHFNYMRHIDSSIDQLFNFINLGNLDDSVYNFLNHLLDLFDFVYDSFNGNYFLSFSMNLPNSILEVRNDFLNLLYPLLDDNIVDFSFNGLDFCLSFLDINFVLNKSVNLLNFSINVLHRN